MPSALIQRVGYLEPDASGKVQQRIFQNPLFDNRITALGVKDGVACKGMVFSVFSSGFFLENISKNKLVRNENPKNVRKSKYWEKCRRKWF